ncbi:MAG: hypothetical protein ACI9MC_001798, partial [Kiritimatiellia bacterium]
GPSTQGAAFAMVAGIADGRVGGGGLSLNHSGARLDLGADAAAWHLVPIDADSALVAEVRTNARWLAWRHEDDSSQRDLTLGAQLAAGSGRQLSPWVRGGVDVALQMGGRP